MPQEGQLLVSTTVGQAITGGTGGDTVIATHGGHLIDMTAGGDNDISVTLPGQSGRDNLVLGGPGNDLLTLKHGGNASNYILHGRRTDGDGVTVVVTHSSSFQDIEAHVTAAGDASLSYGRPTVDSTISTTSWRDIERVDIEGGTGADLLLPRGEEARALGGGGTNTLYADWRGQAAGVTWNLADTLTEAATLANGWEVQGIHRALLRLGDGGNSITTTARGNHIIGGAGDDTLFGAHSGDTFDLSAGGDNRITVTAGTWSGRNNLVIGGEGEDHLTIRIERPDIGGGFHLRLTEPIDGVWIVHAGSDPDVIAAAAPLVGSVGVTFGLLSSVSVSATRFEGVEAVSYIGGTGDDLMIGVGGDETFRGGMGNDVVFGNGGSNTIIGSLAELHGDTVLDFTTLDTIVVEGVELGADAVVFDPVAGRLELARPEGGVSHIFLPGQFEPDAFSVFAAGGETRIAYGRGAPIDLPALRFETVQDGPAVTADLLAALGTAGLRLVALNGIPVGDGVAVTGALGTLDLDPAGGLIYAPVLATALPEGVVGEDAFTVTLENDIGTQAIGSLVFAVTGLNDPASISGDTTGTVIEGSPLNLVAEGLLTVEDPDAGEDRLLAPDPAALEGAHGSFALDPVSGMWRYEANNCDPAVMMLAEGETLTDTLTVTSLDGTATETITITILGSGVREPGEAVTVSGRLVSRAEEPVSGASVTFTPEGCPPLGTVSGTAGDFELALRSGMSGHLEAERGHVPGDPAITTASALETLRMAVGLNPSWGPAGAMDFIAADFNGDGQVTTADALAILRVAVGLTAEHAPRWLFIDSEADLSAVTRSNTGIESGLQLDPVTPQTTDFTLTGILIGHVQEYV